MHKALIELISVSFGFSCLLWSSMLLAAKPIVSALDPIFLQSAKTSLIFQNDKGQILFKKSPNTPRIPASTTKLLTAYLALKHWGGNYRFNTDFFLKDNALIIQGHGDPFLTSEEIAKMAIELSKKLKARQILKLDKVLLDTHFYQKGVVLPGRDASANPYDAVPSALTANFNTVNLKRAQGHYVSAEAQTPLTEVAIRVVKPYSSPLKRMSIGRNARLGEQNFVEILTYFLKKQGIQLATHIVWLKQPYPSKTVFLNYKNSHTLLDMIKPMLKYSTNFIANELALNLSASLYGAPASALKVKKMYQQALENLGWQQAYIEDGAGLSRRNRISAQQLMDLLVRFKPWRLNLLPKKASDIFAKSGSLVGVSTLAGIIHHNHKNYPFVIMINQKMPYHYRYKVAKTLQKNIISQP